MYKKILAPLDMSRLSELSLEQVKKVARADRKTEVLLLIVLEPVSHLSFSLSGVSEKEISKLEKSRPDAATNYLNQIVDKFKKEGIKAKGELAWGSPADEILHYTEEHGADLVIMCTHGSSGIKRWALGSVADKVIRSSTIPVMIVPPSSFRESQAEVEKKSRSTQKKAAHTAAPARVRKAKTGRETKGKV